MLASNNLIANNVVSGRRGALLVNAFRSAGPNTSNHNLFFSPDGPGRARFAWGGVAVAGLAAFRAAGGQDAASLFANPLLVRPGTTGAAVAPDSPAVNAGDPLFAAGLGELDADGQSRVQGGRVDIGADEAA